jgi:hypothetical protein
MDVRTVLKSAAVSAFVLGVTASVFASDLDTMMKQADTAKGHVDGIKKEGGEAKQNV